MGIACVVFYLQMTDVEAGGATVFPILGLRLVPEKVCFQFQFNIRIIHITIHLLVNFYVHFYCFVTFLINNTFELLTLFVGGSIDAQCCHQLID